MNKKIISVLLSVLLIGSAAGLTGCSDGESESLVWYVFGDTPADLQNVLDKANEIIEPKIGMKLDMQYIDSAAYTEKMKLKMASKEAYDLAFTGYINDYQTAVSMGGLYDITELVEEVGMKEEIPEFYLEAAKIDGKIYGIPNEQVISNPPCINIEKALIDELGIDVEAIANVAQNSKTLEERKAYAEMLDDMFGKIHAARPEKYTYNPTSILVYGGYEDVLGGIVLKSDGSSTKLEKKSDTELFEYNMLKLHEWYTKGYIRNDIASKGSAVSNNEEFRQIAVNASTWKPGQDALNAERYGYETVDIVLGKPYVGRKSALLTMTSVGANTKHPKEAVELLKLINTDKELFNIICWGIEGTHYTKNDEGKIEVIKGSGYEGIGKNAWEYGNQFNSLLLVGQDENVWKETEEMNNSANVSPMLGFVPNTDNISSELANISNVNSEYKARTSFGTEHPDKWLAEYKQKLAEAGIDKVLDELQKQYDKFLASK